MVCWSVYQQHRGLADLTWWSWRPRRVRQLHDVLKLHILELPPIVSSTKHTCAMIMLFNQHPDVPHLSGGRIIVAHQWGFKHISAQRSDRNDLVCVKKSQIFHFNLWTTGNKLLETSSCQVFSLFIKQLVILTYSKTCIVCVYPASSVPLPPAGCDGALLHFLAHFHHH